MPMATLATARLTKGEIFLLAAIMFDNKEFQYLWTNFNLLYEVEGKRGKEH